MIDFNNDVPNEHIASFHKYLDFIEDVITRMNRNAFQLKGWCLTIVAALMSLSVARGVGALMLVAALTVLSFGFLDGYYLLMERQFRGLYNDVVCGCDEIKVFSMPLVRYTRKNARNVDEKKKYTYWRVLVSWSVAGFYVPVSLVCFICWIFLSELVVDNSKECTKGVVLEKTVTTNYNYRITEVLGKPLERP